MRQSTRSSCAALKAIGSGGSVNLFSALLVTVGRLPHAPQLSKRAKQRLKWLDYRKNHTVTQTCRHFDLPRSTLHRWEERFDPGNLSTREDRSSRAHDAPANVGSAGSRGRPCPATTVSPLGQGKARHPARPPRNRPLRLDGRSDPSLCAPAPPARRATTGAGDGDRMHGNRGNGCNGKCLVHMQDACTCLGFR